MSVINRAVPEKHIVHTVIEWSADYGVTYTIQFRMRVRYKDNPTVTIWLDWEDLATIRHTPPSSVASPYNDSRDYSINFVTNQPWTDFDLDISSDEPAVQYRVLTEVAGNKHRWFSFIPSTVGANARGFGPYPNTKAYEDVFNQYVYTINRLTKARIELPLTLETNVTTSFCAEPIISPTNDTSHNTLPDGAACQAGCDIFFTQTPLRIDGRVPGCTIHSVSSSGWNDGSAAVCSTNGSALSEGINWKGRCYAYLGSTSQTYSFRIKAEQPALNAVPPALRDSLDSGASGLLGNYTTSISTCKLEYSSSFPGTYCCWNSSPCFYADELARFKETCTGSQTSQCILTSGMTVTPPGLPAADFNLRVDNFAPVSCVKTSCSHGGASTTACFTPSNNNVGGGNLVAIIYPE